MQTIISFPKRGHRRKPGYGLTYKAGDYALYLGDQVAGVRWRDHGLKPRWLAIYRNYIISKHKSRKAAEQACERHARALSK